MGRRKDFIPLRDGDFVSFQKQMVEKVQVNKTVWGIPDPAVDVLTSHRLKYEPLYRTAKAKGTRSSVDVGAHRRERKAYEKDLRAFVNAHLRFNDLIPLRDKVSLGLTLRDTKPSVHPEITDIPSVALRVVGGGDIEVRVRTTTDQTLPSMHPAANLIDYRYILLRIRNIPAKPPADVEDYPKRDVSSRAKFILRLGTKNEGKRFYALFRWINTSKPKQEGPWTEAITVVVA